MTNLKAGNKTTTQSQIHQGQHSVGEKEKLFVNTYPKMRCTGFAGGKAKTRSASVRVSVLVYLGTETPRASQALIKSCCQESLKR